MRSYGTTGMSIQYDGQEMKESSCSPILKFFNLVAKPFKNPMLRLLMVCSLAFISILVFAIIPIFKDNPQAGRLIGVTIAMAILWMTNVIPLAVTALIPLFTFPLFNIAPGGPLASSYLNDVSMMFFGGLVTATAMEKWNLHKRVSLQIMVWCGSNLPLLLFGFMFTSYFLSMWISNTAAALIMTPNALAIVQHMEKVVGKKNVKYFSLSLFLGIAFGCNIGGTATLVGTPPNMFFVEHFKKTFPNAKPPSFFEWFLFAGPLSVIFIIFTYALFFVLFVWKTMKIWNEIKSGSVSPEVIEEGRTTLTPLIDETNDTTNAENVNQTKEKVSLDFSILKDELKKLGKFSYEEMVVLVLFVILVILWSTRSPIFSFKGWGYYIGEKFVTDGTASIFMCFWLFLIPARNTPPGESNKKKFNTIMDWESLKSFPWDVILLFGGGFALADGYISCGLAKIIAESMQSLRAIPVFLLVIIIATVICMLTQVTSNTATAQILLPILASLSVAIKVHPFLLMLPATLSCSLAFALPVSTPTNMIVFVTKRVTVAQMFSVGSILNIVGVILTSLFCYFVSPLIFKFDPSSVPL